LITKSRLTLIAAVAFAALAAASASFADTPKPKPLPQLLGIVGPGTRFTLKNKAGKAVTTLKTGKYAISLNDYSTKQNFHIVGPGLDLTTLLNKKGSAGATVVLRKGTFRYYSDGDRSHLKGTFKVVA
jgi:hypothetical protein